MTRWQFPRTLQIYRSSNINLKKRSMIKVNIEVSKCFVHGVVHLFAGKHLLHQIWIDCWSRKPFHLNALALLLKKMCHTTTWSVSRPSRNQMFLSVGSEWRSDHKLLIACHLLSWWNLTRSFHTFFLIHPHKAVWLFLFNRFTSSFTCIPITIIRKG